MPTHAVHTIRVIANHTCPCPALAGHSAVPAQDILLQVGSPLRDIRREPVGGFAGPIAPDNVVGTYGGTTLLRRQAAGGFAGNPDDQRQGSFADTDRVMVCHARRQGRTRANHRPSERPPPSAHDLARRRRDRGLLDALTGGHALVLTETEAIAAQAA